MTLSAPATPGTYSLRLYVQNEGGFADDTIYSNFLIVRDPAQVASFPFSEGFEQNTFSPMGWQVINPDTFRRFPSWVPLQFILQNPAPTVKWSKYGSAGRGSFGASNTSARIANRGFIERQQRDYLITPQIEIPASAQSPSIEFDVYYRALYWEDLRDTIKSYGYLYGDTLAVSISNDCGQRWQRLYYKGGEELDVTGRAISVINQDIDPTQHRALPSFWTE
ncbi:MAG: hypothetical protein N2170_06635 [Bacteroidia bacterium]|nr:hypothetical protein [Bacteroidia bacterium]